MTPRCSLLLAAGWTSVALSMSVHGRTEGITTDRITLDLSASGHLSSWVDNGTGVNYLAPGQPSPILTVRVDGEDVPPTGLTWREDGTGFILRYGPAGVTAEVAVSARPSHVTFEVSAVSPTGIVELVSWGPFHTILGETIGETVGVVRDSTFAVGIQALNAKTLGGIPKRDDDVMPSYNIFDGGDYTDIAVEFEDQLLYRGDTAVAAPFGSSLQAYCRDRSRSRIISNWGHEKYVAPAYADGGVIGSRIALFGCPTSELMETIASIEQAEGLPHPTIDGEWAKTSRAATASYIIMDFGEANIDDAIAVTRAAGLNYLYHGSPFAAWGHFKLRPDLFPNGWEGFKACVDKAAKSNIRIGFHTLSNFTSTSDPYVTPRPDPRLARIGSSRLIEAIDAAAVAIPIEEPDYFRKPTTLNTVVIDEELITYKQVSTDAPWRLLECTRGAFGTRAATHPAGSGVGKLMDHGYKVFLTDAELAQEQARRIAEFCNRTGAMQLSFDGLEGNWSTGMGQYGRTLFTLAWYDTLAPGLRGRIINDASNPGHFTWHVYTRMNWGEPWYAGFRESQTLYRLKNQFYYSRNLMPRMLGWFALRGDTSIEDAEWLLARAAGFDAGFSLATSVRFAADQVRPGHVLEDRGEQSNLEAILSAVRAWEAARMAGVFPEHLKADLQDVEKEFHLVPGDPGQWKLYRVHSVKARLTADERTVATDQPFPRQPLGFILRNTGKEQIEGLALTLGKDRVPLGDRTLNPGEILKFDGTGPVTVHDASWGIIASLEMPVDRLWVTAGSQDLGLDWADRRPGQELKVEYRTLGEPVSLPEAR